jgi:hypothetical protein
MSRTLLETTFLTCFIGSGNNLPHTNGGLTRFPSLICFVANANIESEQLHRDFDNLFIHSDCRRHLSTDFVATQANGLEKFDQFIAVINNAALDRLTRLIVTKMRTQGQMKGTHREGRTMRPICIPVTGSNAVG